MSNFPALITQFILGWTLFLWLVCIVSTPVTFLSLLIVTFRFLEISRLFMLPRRVLLPCNFTNFNSRVFTWNRLQSIPCGLEHSTDADGCFESKVFAFFFRQCCRTRSSSDLHAMAFGINLFVSVMSSPQARSLRSVMKESNVSPCSWHLLSSLTAAIIGFFLASRCAFNFSVTRSSMSLSLMSCLFSPDPTWTVSHWKVR